jgi:hypothetical protein
MVVTPTIERAAMEIDPELDAVLERRSAILNSLVETAAGPGEGSTVRGLTGPDGKSISRAYVEFYMRRQAEARLAQEARDRRWTRGIAIVAVFISVLALIVSAGTWLFPVGK